MSFRQLDELAVVSGRAQRLERRLYEHRGVSALASGAVDGDDLHATDLLVSGGAA